MKNSIKLEHAVTMGDCNWVGGGYMGCFPKGTTYEKLVQVFGGPQVIGSPDGKAKVEWRGKINDIDFTIYDYKSGCAPEKNMDWHIGGHKKVVASLLITYFDTIA